MDDEEELRRFAGFYEDILEWLEDSGYLNSKGKKFRKRYWDKFVLEEDVDEFF